MSAWLEVWSRPGAAVIEKKIADLPYLDASATVAYSGVGKGSMRLPANYSRLDEILTVDPVTPANSAWSTVKVVSEDGVLYEWLPSPRVPDGDKTATSVDFAGDGIESIWGFARVEPWDWDGSADFVSTFPNWVWGGRNLLGNPGLEASSESPIIDELVIFGTAGTFTLSDGTNTTAAQAFNVSASSLETAIETAGIYDDVLVTGTGSEDNPFIIEAVDPFEGVALTVNPASLTGGTTPRAIITRTQFGSLQPNPWTRSTQVSRGTARTFGNYTSFRVVTTQAHTGTYSLQIDPGPVTTERNRYAGAQQVLTTKAGGTYQASVWVYPTSGTDTYRFIIRGIDGDFIAAYPGGLTSTTLTPNTWNQLTIPDVQVGDNTRVIFRIATTNPAGTNPALFYVDDGEFNEGMAPTTAGAILGAFYVDATSGHPGRVVWEDGTLPGSAYLGIDFDDTVDSDGAAWDRDDLSLTFRPRMSYLQVLDSIVSEGGYEWRLVADAVPGYYLLQVYNPGTLGASVAAGIVGGSTDSSRQGRYFAPQATDLLVQGALEASSRATDTGLAAVFGRIEGSVLDQDLSGLGSISAAASSAVVENRTGAEALVYTLSAPAQKPLALYRPGDTITVNDPTLFTGARRVASIQITLSKAQVDEYVVSLSDAAPYRNLGGGGGGLVLTRGLTGQAATDNAVAALLKAYRRAEELPAPDPGITGGGGAPTVVIAPSDSSQLSKDKADFECPGTDDTFLFQQAVDLAAGGRLLITEGTVQLTRPIVVPQFTKLEGMGQFGTNLRFSGPTATTILDAGTGSVLTDFQITFASTSEVGIDAAENVAVQRVAFFDAGLSATGVLVTGDHVSVVECWSEMAYLVRAVVDFEGVVVANNRIPTGSIDMGDPLGWIVTGNMIENGDIFGGAASRSIIGHNQIINYLGNVFGFSDAAESCVIQGNVIEAPGGAELTLGSGSSFCSVAGNVLGISTDIGINLISAASCSVVGNVLNYPGEHGIRLSASSDCVIEGNLVFGPGQNSNNTFDGIFLEGNSDRNHVTGNRVLSDPLAFVAARYGINVSAATCNDNVVVNNYLGVDAAYGTNALNDAGTATMLVFPAGAFGDNFAT
jgi:parallel beta-helix repeat protein